MSTVVYQNLFSCFEFQPTEIATTLKLELAAPPAPPTADQKNTDLENWDFILNAPKGYGETERLYGGSHFTGLSARSLELCTESLGSETGSDIAADYSSIFSSSSSSSSPPYSPTATSSDFRKQSRSPTNRASRRETTNFPPPLTTMSGASNLQFRRRREGDRLIIEAVEAPIMNSYLEAERSDGRLRLFFPKVSDEEPAPTASAGVGGDKSEEDEFILEEFDDELNWESGSERFQIPGRCNEGRHRSQDLCSSSNWKPALWVVTS